MSVGLLKTFKNYFSIFNILFLKRIRCYFFSLSTLLVIYITVESCENEYSVRNMFLTVDVENTCT